MKKVLWLGPVIYPNNQNYTEAISPAASNWQLKFIEGLMENNVSITLITYMPDQYWPIGKLWVRYPLSDDQKMVKDIIYINYLNLFFIRDLWIPISSFLKILFLKQIDKIEFLFTYNIPFRHKLFSLLLNYYRKRIKWISIIADNHAKGKASLTIFLSHSYYLKFPNNKEFFDGGVTLLKNTRTEQLTDNKPNVILYAGAISKWTGIEEFCAIFDSISNQIDLELHIYGKGESEIINSHKNRNSKIKVFGFVNEAELHLACQNAFVFINPRPINIELGDNNFPSKLLMYLSYNKPILSTKTSNLSPSYTSLLNFYNDKETLMRQIQSLLHSKEYYKEKCIEIEEYAKHNCWKEKIRLLINSIER